VIESSVVHDLLLESMRTALETMFFAAPDSVSMDPRRPAGALIAAKLNFQGTPDGWFWLVVSDTLARTLAANFLGCENDALLLAASVSDVTMELANIMCGAVLSRMESGVNFDLGPPQSVAVGVEESGPDFAAGSTSACRLEFQEGALIGFLGFQETA
jgi:chemotaxis protein CheY-P-specific phosphatase CheC